MLLIAFFEFVYTSVSEICGFVVPLLPEAILSVISYIVNMIEFGLGMIFYIFFDYKVIVPLAGWLLAFNLVVFVYDLLWHIIYMVTLRGASKGN